MGVKSYRVGVFGKKNVLETLDVPTLTKEDMLSYCNEGVLDSWD